MIYNLTIRCHREEDGIHFNLGFSSSCVLREFSLATVIPGLLVRDPDLQKEFCKGVLLQI